MLSVDGIIPATPKKNTYFCDIEIHASAPTASDKGIGAQTIEFLFYFPENDVFSAVQTSSDVQSFYRETTGSPLVG